MHKHFTAWVAVAAVVLIVFAGVALVHADNYSAWLNAGLSSLKEADTGTVPTTLGGYGNIDCSMDDASNCSVPTFYGAATEAGTVRFNSSGSFNPVITYVDARQHFL